MLGTELEFDSFSYQLHILVPVLRMATRTGTKNRGPIWIIYNASLEQQAAMRAFWLKSLPMDERHDSKLVDRHLQFPR